MRGRIPTPTAFKILKGNPGRRPFNGNEAKPALGISDPPEILDAEALKEWRRIAPELERVGLVTFVDCAGFTAYCMAWSEYVGGLTALLARGRIGWRPGLVTLC